MTIVKEQSIARYICSYRFLAFVLVCICLAGVLGAVYYVSEVSEATEDEHEDISVPADRNISIPITTEKEVSWDNNEEIEIFREYLRIRTDHPDIDYEPAVEFLKKQAEKIELPVSIHYPVNNENPIVVMSWTGSQPEMPSILLNSHMDVVPAFEKHWTHPPFAADMDENGNIYARGAQDMKGIGMQYLAAIRALKNDGVEQLKRTIHIVYVPDEEMGSALGMKEFVYTEPFKQLNVGFALDEGIPSPVGEPLRLHYAERATWRIEFICYGTSGHGSIMFENTAAEKLSYLIYKLNQLRRIESTKKPDGRNTTSINLTVINGGLEGNVVPPEVSAIFDVRLAVDADHDAFERMFDQWCEEAGGNITINYHIKDPKAVASVVNDTNPFWTAFKSATDDLSLPVVPMILGAASDSRFVRSVGIPAFGFSPLFNTTAKYHGNDEYLNADVYLAGIEIYKKIIPNLSNVE